MTSNMTQLFEQPSPRFHSCENFWSSLFALQLVQLSSRLGTIEIPVHRFSRPDRQSWAYAAVEPISIECGLTVSNVIVDGNLRDDFLPGIKVQHDHSMLRPDITIIEDDRLLFFENKTVGAVVSQKEDWYGRFASSVADVGKDYRAFTLISLGNTDEGSWRCLMEQNIASLAPKDLVLWEAFGAYVLEQFPDGGSILELLAPDEARRCCIRYKDQLRSDANDAPGS